jgi:hypothetical protein
MRSLIIAAAALIAVAAPGVANANTGGRVGVAIAGLDSDDDPDKEGAWAVNGLVLTEMTPAWAVQFRGQSVDMDHGDHSDGFSQVEIGANYQVNDMFSVGAFVGQDTFFGDAFLTYGLAARVDFNNFNVGASISGGDNVNGDEDEINNIAVEGGFSGWQGFYIGVHGSWSDLGSVDVESYGAALDYFIPGTNMTIGAFYRNSDHDFGETEAIGIRASINFGTMPQHPLMGSEHMLYDGIGAT